MTKVRPHISLEGRVALVTGSTRGIGLATAEILASAGAHVVISGRKDEDCARVALQMRARGLSAEARVCHIGRYEDIDAMEAHLRQAHGGLDILVNNAVLSPLRAIEDTDRGLFAKAVEVNFQGYWYMSTAAVKLMKQRGGGSIVNIASVAAMHPDRGLGLYSTLKTALIGMTRSFALEHGADGIRCNTILPGLVDTRLAGKYDAEERNRIVARIPLGRLGEPEEIGQTVLFLASGLASYVTGASFVVDGGLSVALF